ncbi:MAG: hypoxanthine phosphoribosyltransferase [Gemmatimonadota bacterium]
MPKPVEPQPSRTLIDEAALRRRVAELAERISRDYGEADELVLVGVLKGAFIFLADLARQLTIPRRIEFMGLSSYRSGDRRGAVRLILDLRSGIAGKHVLVVEDIVDSGHTLHYLFETLAARHPASLEACVLVQKQERLEVDLEVRYVGFTIPDVWVVGYGLDYGERYRTLPYIGVLEARSPPGPPEVAERRAAAPPVRAEEDEGS